MYSTPTQEWDAAMQDWRQVGIMCHYILVDEAENVDYHTLEVKEPSYQYFITMFTTGRICVGAFLVLSHQFFLRAQGATMNT